MRREIFPLLLFLVSLASAGEVWVEKGEKETAIGNEQFTLYLARERGWLLDRLEDKKAGIILSGFHIYTDWGIYPQGYVGSMEEREGRLKIEKEREDVIAIAEGELKGNGKRMEEPIKYSVRYRVGKEARLGIDIELEFEGKPRKVSAFLAATFLINSAKQWLVNDLDGIISENIGNVVGRCWQSRDEPLSMDRAFIRLLTKWGDLRIEDIRAQPHPQNIFLYDDGEGNLALFIAFMDGVLQEIGGRWQASYIIEWVRKR